jgi:hypothetical protein
MSDIIFDFVRSLTLREKAYFKRYAQLHNASEDKNYLKIYTYFEKQKKYDEQALKIHFKGETFVKYLSSEKHYLLEQILNSLINYHSNTSTNRKLLKLILYINILSEKGFRKKATKIIQKAKTLAYRHEEFTIILQLIQMEEEILFSHGILNYVQQLETLKEEREEITKKIQNLNELRLLKAQARELQFEYMPHVSNPSKYPHIFENPLLANINHIKSLKAQEVWYYIKCITHYLIRDFEKSQRYYKDYLSFFEKNEYLFSINQKLPVLSNYMYLSAKIKDEKHFMIGHQKLIDLLGKKDIDAAYIYYIKYARMLELYHKVNNQPAAKKLLPEISDYIDKNSEKFGSTEIDHIIILLIRAGIETKQFDKAQQWVNLWYKKVTIEVSLNIVKLFALIIYYELKYFNLLTHEVSSTYKILKSRKKLTKLEQSFIRFFKKILHDPHSGKNQKTLKTLHESLSEIKKDPTQNILFEQFDFLKWCEDQGA